MSKEQELGNIFNQAQKTLAAHQRCIQALEKHYTKNPAAFPNNFINMVKRLLLIFKRDAHIERAVQLVISFACKTEIKIEDNAFSVYLIKFLLDLCDIGKPAKQAELAKAIRFRSCQIIAGILNNLPEEAEIDDPLWAKLSKTMVERMMDKIPVVRVQAIAALSRLQEPSDPSDQILSQYLKLMNTDTNKDVRKAVLTHIGLSKVTLPEILKRTRDVLPDVRKHAFSMITKLEIKSLTIAQRNTLVKNGLNDRDSAVRDACVKTCEGWLQSRGNLIEFLKCFDVENYEDNAILLLKQLLSSVRVEKDILSLDVERVSPELAILFRTYCEKLKQDKNEELLEDTVPELMQYCEILAKHRDDNFVLKQMLQISSFLNLSNEAGRKALSSLLRHLLLSRSVENNLIERMMLVLREIHPVEDDYNNIILETISEVREPLESLEDPETQQALKELDEYLEELDAEILKKKQLLKKTKQREAIEALTAEISAKEAEVKEIEEKENMRLDVEEWAWLRCLTLTQNLLRYTTKSLKDGGIAELKEAVFAGGIQHENPEVREAAMGCLGVYCLLDKAVAFKHVLLLRHALDNDDISVRGAALKTLCDIISVFGSNFKVEVEEKMEDYSAALGTDPTEYLSRYLRSEESSLRDVAAQGLSRLFLSKIATSKLVMKEMILSFFIYGDSSSGSILQQCLSVFFPTFAFASDKNQALIASVAIDIFRDVAYASKTSLLHKVQLQTLLQFIVHLTDHNNLVKKPIKPAAFNAAGDQAEIEAKNSIAHNELAEKFLLEFMTNPTGKESKFLAKTLATLAIDKSDRELIQKLRAMADVASSDIAESKDRVTIKAISTFEDILKSLDVSNELPAEELKSEIREKAEEYSSNKAKWLDQVEAEESRAQKAAAKSKKTAAASKPAKGGKQKKVVESDEEVESDISSVSSVEDESIELESDDDVVAESDESDIEDEEEPELTKPKPKNNIIKDEDAPPRTRKIVKDDSDSDLELSDDDEEEEDEKPVKSQPRLSNVSARKAKEESASESDISDLEADSLLLSDDEEKNDRREAEQKRVKAAAPSKRVIEDSDDEDETESEAEEPSPVKKPAARRQPAAKKSRAVVSNSEDEDLSLSSSEEEDDDEFDEDSDISDISEIEEDDVEPSPIKKKVVKKKRAIESDDEKEDTQVTPVKNVSDDEESDKENDQSSINQSIQSPIEAKPEPKPVQPAAAKTTVAGKVQRPATSTTSSSVRTSVVAKPTTANRPSMVPAPRPSIASSTTAGVKKPVTTTTTSRPSIATAAPRPSIASSTTVAKPAPRPSIVGTAAAKPSTIQSRPSITPASRPSIASSRPSLATSKPTTTVPQRVTKPAVPSAARPSVVSKELRSEIDRVLERSESPDTKKENLVNKKPAMTAAAKPSGIKKPAVYTKPVTSRPSISSRVSVEQTPMVKAKPNPALLNTTTKNLRAQIDSLLD